MCNIWRIPRDTPLLSTDDWLALLSHGAVRRYPGGWCTISLNSDNMLSEIGPERPNTKNLNISERRKQMPKYIIERELPGAGDLGDEEIQGISQKSCQVLNELGPQIQWVESFVTDDKIYCVYNAPNKEMIEKHAQEGGFPANKISKVRRRIDPTSAEG